MPKLLINPVVRWAVHPADQGRIAYVDGASRGEPLPREGDVITRPFLVDPTTREPVPVRVAEIQERRQPDILVVVVTREH